MKKADKLINEGINYQKMGQFDIAYTKYSEAIKLDPKNPKLLYFFGILEGQRDNAIHAEQLLEKCSKLVPNDVDIEYNLGTLCQKLGKHKKAIKRLKRAVEINPRYHLAFLNLGASYMYLEDYENATDAFNTVLTLEPENDDAIFNLCKAYYYTENWTLFLRNFNKIDHSSRHFDDVTLLYCNFLLNQEKPVDAIEFLDSRLIQIHNKAVALTKIGDIYFSLRNLTDAKTYYQKAIDKEPQYNNAYTSLSKLLFTLGDIDGALTCLKTGELKCSDNRLIKANMALIELSDEQFKDGWKQYIYRSTERSFSTPPPFPPLGNSLSEKTIYFVPDQGLGDQLFFLRFIPELLKRNVQVKIHVHEKIAVVLKSSEIYPLLVEMRDIPIEGEIYELGDIPYLLECSEGCFLPPLPLRVEHRPSMVMSNGLPNIGISWRGGINDGKTLYKEIELSLLLTSLKEIEANWYILQRNPSLEEIEFIKSELKSPIIDASHLNEDLEKMLVILDQLDEQVGVSNTNVHLRCSLGKGGKALIPNPPDWRWLMNKEESPWVPGYKIYRQSVDDDWSHALDQLTADLIKQYT